MSLVNAALRCARRGWAVLLLYGVRKGGACRCGNATCTSPGKHPRVVRGVKAATTDERIIRKWFEESPNANFAIATGTPSGIIVLDVDAHSGGFDSLRQLEAEYGPLPVGPVVKTGGGGKHYYLAWPVAGLPNKIGLRPGIDLRADGGYVVGAPSGHFSGRRYLWAHGKTPEKVGIPPCPQWLVALIGETPRLSGSNNTIPRGQRNSTLTSLAGTMHARGMSLPAIEAALLQENRTRCYPPLEEAEVQRIVLSVAQYPERIATKEHKTLPFRTADEFAIATPADVPWICKPFVAQNCIAEITGKVKDGKTTFVVDLIAAVVYGRAFLGQPTTKTSVIYLSEEGDVTLNQALLRANLRQNKGLTLLLHRETVGWTWPAIVKAAAAECKKRNANVLVIDTFAQFSGLEHGQENTSGDVLAAIRPLRHAAVDGLGIVLVHHERKTGGNVADSGRGSSALAGAVDLIASIRRPEGSSADNVRLVQTSSRFTETPPELLIELTPSGYQVLGSPAKVAIAEAASSLLAEFFGPKSPPIKIKDLVTATKRPRAYVQHLLDELVEQGTIEKLGRGTRGNPFRWVLRSTAHICQTIEDPCRKWSGDPE